MTDATNLIRIVQETQPDEIYNLAAQRHVHGARAVATVPPSKNQQLERNGEQDLRKDEAEVFTNPAHAFEADHKGDKRDQGRGRCIRNQEMSIAQYGREQFW